MNELKSVDFYGLKVSIFTEKELEIFLENSILEKSKLVCYGYSFATIPYFRQVPELYFYTRSFDVLVCDGRIFYLFGKLLGFPFKSDISIPNLVYIVLDIAQRNKFSIQIFGSTDDINSKACQCIKKNYPAIRLLEGINGYYDWDEEEGIVNRINSDAADILLIGISTPIKERFAYQYKNQIDCRIIIPCGGMIDVLAGLVKLSPYWVKKIGFATFYRIAQEPRRLLLLHSKLILHALFKIMPGVLFRGKVLRDKKFSFPGLYGIKIK